MKHIQSSQKSLSEQESTRPRAGIRAGRRRMNEQESTSSTGRGRQRLSDVVLRQITKLTPSSTPATLNGSVGQNTVTPLLNPGQALFIPKISAQNPASRNAIHQISSPISQSRSGNEPAIKINKIISMPNAKRIVLSGSPGESAVSILKRFQQGQSNVSQLTPPKPETQIIRIKLPKQSPPEMNFFPSAVGDVFSILLGLEQVVGQLHKFENKKYNRQEEEVRQPSICSQCSKDYSPSWKKTKYDGSVTCTQCVNEKQKKTMKEAHSKHLHEVFTAAAARAMAALSAPKLSPKFCERKSAPKQSSSPTAAIAPSSSLSTAPSLSLSTAPSSSLSTAPSSSKLDSIVLTRPLHHQIKIIPNTYRILQKDQPQPQYVIDNMKVPGRGCLRYSMIKRKDGAVVYESGGYQYRTNTFTNDLIILECIQKKSECEGKATISRATNKFTCTRIHNHIQQHSKTNTLEETFRRDLHESAENSITDIRGIYHQVSARYDNHITKSVPFESVKRSMQYHKTKGFPLQPNNFHQFITAIRKHTRLRVDLQGCVEKGGEVLAAVFYSKLGIAKFQDFSVITFSNQFKFKPSISKQFLIISAKYEKTFAPAIIVWFKNINALEAQKRVFKMLSTNLPKFHVKTAIVNGSMGMIKAFRATNPGSEVRICFHFYQSRIDSLTSSVNKKSLGNRNILYLIQELAMLVKSLGLLSPEKMRSVLQRLPEFDLHEGTVYQKNVFKMIFGKFTQEWIDFVEFIDWKHSMMYDSYKYNKQFELFHFKRFQGKHDLVWDYIGKCNEILETGSSQYIQDNYEEEVRDKYLSLNPTLKEENVEGKLRDVDMLAKNMKISLDERVQKYFLT